jgi:hypothetical protein
MSEKRTVIRSIQLNVFDDQNIGLMVSPGTSIAQAVAILHHGLGMAISQMAKEQGDGNGKRKIVVPTVEPKGV